MKVLIIGGTGTIGKKVAENFSKKHEVLVAGKSRGDILVDITNTESIKAMFNVTGDLDGIICIAGEAKWGKFDELTEEDFYVGIKSKMMGQVNITRIGKDFLKPNGSITLTTGILGDFPVDMTTSAAMVNGAVNSFAKAVSLELTKGQRINVVSSDLVEDSLEKYQDYFPGHTPVPMNKVINAYKMAFEGKINGQILSLREWQ